MTYSANVLTFKVTVTDTGNGVAGSDQVGSDRLQRVCERVRGRRRV
ncbi:MAG: hypothetical protein ACOX62_06500 [Christensenellales bacterium]